MPKGKGQWLPGWRQIPSTLLPGHGEGLLQVLALCVPGPVPRDAPSCWNAACRLSLTPRQIQEALTPGHLKKAKLMFFFTRYPSSALLKTYFLDVQVKWQCWLLVPGMSPVQRDTQPTSLGTAGKGMLSCPSESLGTAGKGMLSCPPASLVAVGAWHILGHGLP